jgi:CheY-like chemotaxis protein
MDGERGPGVRGGGHVKVDNPPLRPIIRRMRILLVEDQAKLLSFAKKGLEEQGIQVDAVSDGDEAWEMATTVPYDALVLDIMVPGRDGLSILRGLREKRNTCRSSCSPHAPRCRKKSRA